MEKDPFVLDMFQPLLISYDTYQITYTSSLFSQNELELLENTTQ